MENIEASYLVTLMLFFRRYKHSWSRNPGDVQPPGLISERRNFT
jgi:hypothetical protein